MGYTLIWIEGLAAALLLVALVTACAAHWPRRLGQTVLPILVATVLFTLAAGTTFVAGAIKFGAFQETDWFPYTLSWTLVFTIGVGVVFRGGRRPGQTEAIPPARAWSRSKLALALGVMVLLDGITFTNMDLAMKVQMASVRAEAGAMGVALLPLRVPDRDNAALVYQEAFEALTPWEKIPLAWREKAAVWFELDPLQLDPRDKDLREFLQSQRRGLTLLRKGAALPGCAFERNYAQAIELQLPDLDQLRHGARLLALHALAKAADGESREALDDVAAIFGIAGHINDPILISLVVAMSVDRMGVKALEEVCALRPPRAADLERLSLDGSTSYRRAVHRACRMEEAAIGLSSFAMLAGEKPALWVKEWEQIAGPVWLFRSPVWRVFLLPDDLAAYRRTMKEIQEATARPYPEAYQALQELDQSLRRNRRGLLTSLIIPYLNNCVRAAAETDAARQLARLALAVLAYRSRNGKDPDKLDQLVPEYLERIPLDPFDGQPLRLKRGDKGLVLYSVGRDLKDDGGTPWDTGKQEGDLVFRLR